MIKILCLTLVLIAWTAIGLAENELSLSKVQEPRLYDHYLALKRMQESIAGRSLEEQARLQPYINLAERRACEQVRRERQEGVPKEDYRQQGGGQFLVFAQQLEQYCLSIR